MTRRPKGMPDWNVVATARDREFAPAARLLQAWGPVQRTAYYNVLVCRVADPAVFAEELAGRLREEAGAAEVLARAVPATRTFDFRSAEAFEEGARAAALEWAPELAGRSFHVRMHRRGFRKKLGSQGEERFLNGALLEELERRGGPGKITFADPDAILAVETVGGRAGLSLWSREDLVRYPFLRLD